jgi:FHS family L-fucose permease-like MFS transporter
MACGQSFLEVAANPYVTILGPADSAERRLNVAQCFNSVGAMLTPISGSLFILSRIPHPALAMTMAQLQDLRTAEARAVELPYVGIVVIFLVVATIISVSKLPEVPAAREAFDGALADRGDLWALMKYRHFVLGVLALFFYVGAQVGVASFVIRLVEHVVPGTSDVAAANYLKLHLLGFMLGRFGGSALMKRFSPAALLAGFAAGCVACALTVFLATGMFAIWAVAVLGCFHSIMFPTIFALSLRGLGPYTKIASSFLVMAIIGGAILPALMGLISDASNIQTAFLIPLACYVAILFFALTKDNARVTSTLAGSEIRAPLQGLENR